MIDNNKTFIGVVGGKSEPQKQADWNQSDSTAVDFIKNKPTNLSDFNNDEGFITNDEVLNYKQFPSDWPKTGTMAQLIAAIAADDNATEGMSYLATVTYSDLPTGLMQAEMQVDIMADEEGLGKNVLFTVTSSDVAPYHWEYTSAYGQTGEWRTIGGTSEQDSVTVTGATPTISVQENKVYTCTSAVTSVTISAVENSVLESNLYFTTDATGCTLSLPNTLVEVFGSTTLEPSTNYSLSFKDNRAVIVSPTSNNVPVVNNNPTLAYGTAATIGTVNGTALSVTMPATPSQTIETVTGATPSIAIAADKVYNCTTAATSVTVSSVENSTKESNLYFTTDASGCTLSLPNTLVQVFGSTTLEPSTSYTISFKDNRAVIVAPDSNAVDVVNNNPTLAYNTAATIGTVNGTALSVTMPNIPSQATETVTGTTPSFAVAENKVYTCSSALTSLTITSAANSNLESNIYFTTDASGCTLSLPNTLVQIFGSTTLEASTSYAIAIKDNRAVIVAPNSNAIPVVNNNPTLAYGTAATIGTVNGTALSLTMPAQPTFTQTQANWSESDSNAAGYIQNKPTIPAAQVQTDWNAASGMGQLLNKPSNFVMGANNTAYTIWVGTQAEYDLLTPDASTVYLIKAN